MVSRNENKSINSINNLTNTIVPCPVKNPENDTSPFEHINHIKEMVIEMDTLKETLTFEKTDGTHGTGGTTSNDAGCSVPYPIVSGGTGGTNDKKVCKDLEMRGNFPQ